MDYDDYDLDVLVGQKPEPPKFNHDQVRAFGIGFICGAGCLLLGELILAFIFKK